MGREQSVFSAVLWIRIVFNADLDPAFYLNADPDPGSQTNADPDPYPDSDPGQTLKSQKVEFYVENIFQVGTRSSKTCGIYEGTKAFLKGRKPGFFVNFGRFPCSWIQDSHANADPDSQY
jgi:hypothetical protein